MPQPAPRRPRPRSGTLVRIARIVGLVGVLTTALAGVGGVVASQPAAAHSRLVKISPADGSSVRIAPGAVVLTFNEDVLEDFSAVRVTNSAGRDVTYGAPSAQGPVVRQALHAGLPPGRYAVAYRVVSADSHPISGRSSFTVLRARSASPTASASSSDASGSAGSPGDSASTDPGTPSSSPPGTAPSGTPSSAASATGAGSAASSPPAGDGSGGGSAPWWVLGLVAAAAVVGGAAWWTRRGRASSPQ